VRSQKQKGRPGRGSRPEEHGDTIGRSAIRTRAHANRRADDRARRRRAARGDHEARRSPDNGGIAEREADPAERPHGASVVRTREAQTEQASPYSRQTAAEEAGAANARATLAAATAARCDAARLAAAAAAAIAAATRRNYRDRRAARADRRSARRKVTKPPSRAPDENVAKASSVLRRRPTDPLARVSTIENPQGRKRGPAGPPARWAPSSHASGVNTGEVGVVVHRAGTPSAPSSR